jgi:hypothetical protein
MNPIRVFIASPGDVPDERDIASLVVSEVHRIFSGPLGLQLDAVRWETHAVPDVGDDAQAVINRQIGDFDIFVGMMWQRFGSPTKRNKSGTGEEFERAYRLFKNHGRPKIMFYFRTTPFYTPELEAISQFRKVVEFRKKLERLGVLYWTYQTPLEFERNVREHLIRQLIQANNDIAKSEARPVRTHTPREISVVAIATAGHAPEIFLGYSFADRDQAQLIYQALRAAGYGVWMDAKNLLPGQMLHSELERAIRQSKVILLLLSSKSQFVRGWALKEVEIAQRLSGRRGGTPVLPVRLDNVELPAGLRALQWIDYFASNGLERLVEAIGRIVNKNH